MAQLNPTMITALEELSCLKEDWAALMQTAGIGNIFLTWEWVYTWCQHYLGDNELCTVLFRDDQKRLVGIAPCYIQSVLRAGLVRQRTMRFLGTEEVCPAYLDFIASRKHKKQVIESFYGLMYGGLKAKWDVAEFSEMPAESISIDYLSEFVGRDGKVFELSDPVASPFIKLPPSIDGFLSSISANERYNLQRKRKRLESAGVVTWERVTLASEFPKAMDSFIGLHQSRWEGKGEAGAFKRPRFESFHREIGERFAAQGMCTFDFLKLDGETIAGIYGYQYQGRFSFYLPGFNHNAVPEASPGLLLLFRCIELAIAQSLREFDLLRGVMPYKLAWATGLHRSLTVTIYTASISAAMVTMERALRKSAKVLVR